MAESLKPTSRYAIKHRHGVEVNHAKHPKEGIAWCETCQAERRPNTYRTEYICYACLKKAACMLPVPMPHYDYPARYCKELGRG